MLKMPPRLALPTCISPAVPVSCMAVTACMDTPVAPIGWALALSPPAGWTGQRPLPGFAAAFELEHVALRHRQEILDVLGRTEGDCLAELERSGDVGEDDGGRAVRDQRAVRTLERPRDAWILLALGGAELVAPVLADLGLTIAPTI